MQPHDIQSLLHYSGFYLTYEIAVLLARASLHKLKRSVIDTASHNCETCNGGDAEKQGAVSAVSLCACMALTT
jgi:hypothetical protein